MTTESKAERFQRIAERRVNETIRALRLLGNLSDRRNYDYTPEEATLVLGAVEKEFRAFRARFMTEAHGTNKPFRLGKGL
jgi:hypothetical protein